MSSVANRRVGRGMTANSSKPASAAPGVTQEEGFEVKSECGRSWFVPMSAVQANYAAYLVEADGLEPGAALLKAGASTQGLYCWFAEQFDWADVETHGRTVRDADAKEVLRALNSVRSGGSPSDRCILVNAPAVKSLARL